MARFPIFQVDAFAGQVFRGNPAAVCPLERWLDDKAMQSLAAENNLSETAFFIPSGDDEYDYHLRWFTPVEEVDLCGHATLASAYVIFEKLGFAGDRVRFKSLSGSLTVQRMDEMLALDFPEWPLEKVHEYAAISKALGVKPREVYRSPDWLAVLDSEKEVRELAPDFHAMKGLECRGVIVTAPSERDGVDFVSRAFFPKLGIEEDPVTGSAHCALVPYWAERSGKTTFRAQQISKRLGELYCERRNGRIIIAGKAQLYMEGEYILPA